MSTTDEPVAATVQGDAGAARYLRMSERFVRGERLSGNLKSFRLGNRVMFRIADLDAYIERAVQQAERRAEAQAQRELRRERRRRGRAQAVA